MKYSFDIDSNNMFVQIFGATESLRPMEAPLAFQIRANVLLLERLDDALDEVHATIATLDKQFHDDVDARNAFELGFVVFRPGDVMVTCAVQRRMVTVMLGLRQVGDGPLELADFRSALKKALKKQTKN